MHYSNDNDAIVFTMQGDEILSGNLDILYRGTILPWIFHERFRFPCI